MQPSSQPSRRPSTQPSRLPSSQPTLQPTNQPSSQPSRRPSMQPSTQPSQQPSEQPTRRPSSQPTHQPTRRPSQQPTMRPSRQPSSQPTRRPSGNDILPILSMECIYSYLYLASYHLTCCHYRCSFSFCNVCATQDNHHNNRPCNQIRVHRRSLRHSHLSNPANNPRNSHHDNLLHNRLVS